MNKKDEVIRKFYTAFQQLDYKAMNGCYSDNVVFFDPVFNLLHGERVFAMWEMLCKNAKDFELVFGNILMLDDEYTSCEWTAAYTFSATGRKVINKAKAYMRFADGKIIEHSDGFSIHKWSMQALGFSGWLLGWNRFFQNRIKNKATRNLQTFMEKKS